MQERESKQIALLPDFLLPLVCQSELWVSAETLEVGEHGTQFKK